MDHTNHANKLLEEAKSLLCMALVFQATLNISYVTAEKSQPGFVSSGGGGGGSGGTSMLAYEDMTKPRS